MGELPNRIRALREANGWSLAALAAAVGCSKMQLSDLERGGVNLTVEWMRRIAQPLRVKPGDLLLESDQPEAGALDPAELALIQRFRAASPAERDSLLRIADALPQGARRSRRSAQVG